MITRHDPHARLGVDLHRRRLPPAASGSSTRLVDTTRDGDWRIHVRDEHGVPRAGSAAPAWFGVADGSDESFCEAET